MIKLIKSTLFSCSLFFAANSFSQEIAVDERARIEQECKAKTQRNLETLRALGHKATTSEKLLEKCIKNGIEISFFNSYNTIKNTQELYNYTVSALDARLIELRNLNTTEAKELYTCFSKQQIALNFAINVNESFLKRALITTNNLLRNNCAR